MDRVHFGLLSCLAAASYTCADACAYEEDPAAAKPNPALHYGEMIDVPAGPALLGDPPASVEVAAFAIDRTEVTVDAYGRCVRAGACTAPDTGGACTWNKTFHEHHPVNCVSWAQADAYCRFDGKRLPTDAEWEKAARGTDGRIYAWGDEGLATKPLANIADKRAESRLEWSLRSYDDGFRYTSPAGTYPAGASPYGAVDMIGNVFEWTADWAEPGKERSIRGGSWYFDPATARAAARGRFGPDARVGGIGFRCVR